MPFPTIDGKTAQDNLDTLGAWFLSKSPPPEVYKALQDLLQQVTGVGEKLYADVQDLKKRAGLPP